MTIENNENKEEFIAFFDSGLGGISVMKEAIKLLPNENFVYFGDSKNAPYGTKSVDDVKKYSFQIVKKFIEYGAKAIVIACNTATSAAAKDLRKKYPNIPIVGIEPALKPAVENNKNGKIIVMATNVTLSEKKFKSLMTKYGEDIDIIPLPCPGLMEFVERGELQGERLNKFLKEKFKNVDLLDIDSIVLGCTHYPFLKSEIQNLVGNNVKIIDGSIGTAKEVKRRLIKLNKLNKNNIKGIIKIYNSINSEEMINLSYKLLQF